LVLVGHARIHIQYSLTNKAQAGSIKIEKNATKRFGLLLKKTKFTLQSVQKCG
jgi:hypothetical protein